MKIINYILICVSLFLTSCKPIKEIPIHEVEKIIYRDTFIYVYDTLKIEIPYENLKETTYIYDTSYLKTNFAESIAYIDTSKQKLHHTLIQKGELTTIYDTVIKIQYIDKIIEKDVPITVDVIKYKRDSLFWVLVIWALVCLIFFIYNLFFIKR